MERKGRGSMSFDRRVNNFLAGSVSVINALFAVGYPVLVALMTGIGFGNAVPGGFSFAAFLGGLIIGGLVSCLITGFFCGMLAVLIDIRNSLVEKGDPSERRE